MSKGVCYSDHNEDIRTKGSCDYCGGTENDPTDEHKPARHYEGEPVGTFDMTQLDTPVLPYGGVSNPNSGHAGSDTSRAAAVEQDVSGATSEQQQRVLGGIGLADTYGMTVGEVRRWTGYHHGTASRVLSDLHAAGLVCRLTETRDRAKVYVLPEHLAGRETEPQGRTATVQLLDDMADLLDSLVGDTLDDRTEYHERAVSLLARHAARRHT